MGGLFTLAQELQDLNDSLVKSRSKRVNREALRAGLETHVGEFRRAKRMNEKQTDELFEGRTLLGVDGSVNTVGGNYPYTIHLFKALAKSTKPNAQGGTFVEKVDLLSPLRVEDQRDILIFLEEKRQEIKVAPQEEQERERELAEQQAYQMLADQRMVEMELQVAINAIEQFDARVVLMDGGFSRLKGKGGDLWDKLVQTALDHHTILVGVIEEVGSFRLKSRLDPELLTGFLRGHDREVLFNTLDQGEWLKTSLERPIKNDFYTVFTRLSDLPQAGACDFLREQAAYAEQVVDFLYTITPSKSRGIPLWLDVVDAEVRLTKKQIDLIVKTNIDIANIEVFLRPQRDRRDF